MRILPFGFAVLALGASTAAARAEPPPKNVILADLGLHVIGVGYQRTLTPWLAAQIALDPYFPWVQNLHILGPEGEPDTDIGGLVVRERFFFYPFRTAPSGAWISPFGQFGLAMATRDGTKQLGSVGAIGVSAGYSFLLARRVHIALGLGAQYHAAKFVGGERSPNFAGFSPTLDGNLGYAF